MCTKRLVVDAPGHAHPGAAAIIVERGVKLRPGMMKRRDRLLERHRPAAMLADERNCLLARQRSECLLVVRAGPVDAVLHADGAEPVVLDLARKVAEPKLLAHRPPGLALIREEIERDPAVPR